jgi:hypothetical protein
LKLIIISGVEEEESSAGSAPLVKDFMQVWGADLPIFMQIAYP